MEIIFPHLGIEIKALDRVCLNIFGFSIYWYGVLICLGALVGIILVTKIAKAQGEAPDTYTDFALWALIFGVIGARAYYLIFYNHSLAKFWAIRDGGLAIYGGIIGGLIAVVIFSKIKKINVFTLTDNIAFGLLCGQIFGRWGNFVNREAFGGYTDSLFAMAYKTSTVPSLKVIAGQGIYNKAIYPITQLAGESYIQVHPTFLYESCWNLCVLIFLLCYRKKKKYVGELTAIYFICYGVGRFWIESLRTDQLMIGSFPVSMLLSLLLAVVAGGFEIAMRYKISKDKKAIVEDSRKDIEEE